MTQEFIDEVLGREKPIQFASFTGKYSREFLVKDIKTVEEHIKEVTITITSTNQQFVSEGYWKCSSEHTITLLGVLEKDIRKYLKDNLIHILRIHWYDMEYINWLQKKK